MEATDRPGLLVKSVTKHILGKMPPDHSRPPPAAGPMPSSDTENHHVAERQHDANKGLSGPRPSRESRRGFFLWNRAAPWIIALSTHADCIKKGDPRPGGNLGFRRTTLRVCFRPWRQALHPRPQPSRPILRVHPNLTSLLFCFASCSLHWFILANAVPNRWDSYCADTVKCCICCKHHALHHLLFPRIGSPRRHGPEVSCCFSATSVVDGTPLSVDNPLLYHVLAAHNLGRQHVAFRQITIQGPGHGPLTGRSQAIRHNAIRPAAV